jgi:hypothetical protein
LESETPKKVPDFVICPGKGNLEWHRNEAAMEARANGLEKEVLEAFDAHISAGDSPCDALEAALYDWDIA